MQIRYTIDVIVALAEGEEATDSWWSDRLRLAAVRAGGMPPELAEPEIVDLSEQTDPDSGERSAILTFALPLGTTLARTREIAHMLTSVMVAEGFIARGDGERLDLVPGNPEAVEGELGPLDFTQARVCSQRCMDCVMATETRYGCCTEGAGFSLADLGATLLSGGDELVAAWLALPGDVQADGKLHPYLTGGICCFHDPARGCTLPREQMPLQCRTYLCAPDQLLPAPLQAEYSGYVEALEEAERFIEEHMRHESGVGFNSTLTELRRAAERAFAAWSAGEAGESARDV